MKRLLSMFSLGLILSSFCASCQFGKKSYYSYNLVTHGNTNTSKDHIFMYSSLISFEGYVFEFKTRTYLEETKCGDSSVVKSLYYDTTGVFVLCQQNKKYYEFDSFKLNSKLLDSGSIFEKKYGITISEPQKNDSFNIDFKDVKEISVNGINCYSITLRSDKMQGQSQDLILIKNRHFNSPYRVYGANLKNNDYCIVGYRMFDSTDKQWVNQEIKNLHPLAEEQVKICKYLISVCGF